MAKHFIENYSDELLEKWSIKGSLIRKLYAGIGSDV